MPRPIIMQTASNADASKSTSFIAQLSKATVTCVRYSRRTTPITNDVVLVAQAGDQHKECGACEPEAAPMPAPAANASTSAVLESADVLSAIASQISDKTTLAALSRADKTAHEATSQSLAASKAQHIQEQAALTEGRFKASYYPKYNPGLLRLSGAKLSGEDVDALVELLKHNSILTTLYLKDCDLDAAAGMAIAAALTDNLALTSLDLRDNNINVGGAKAFAAALGVNRTLTDLDLRNNALCGKQKWDVLGPVSVPKDMSGVEALCKAAKKAS